VRVDLRSRSKARLVNVGSYLMNDWVEIQGDRTLRERENFKIRSEEQVTKGAAEVF